MKVTTPSRKVAVRGEAWVEMPVEFLEELMPAVVRSSTPWLNILPFINSARTVVRRQLVLPNRPGHAAVARF